jgi:hypothetical protein
MRTSIIDECTYVMGVFDGAALSLGGDQPGVGVREPARRRERRRVALPSTRVRCCAELDTAWDFNDP